MCDSFISTVYESEDNHYYSHKTRVLYLFLLNNCQKHIISINKL
ncbi:hypothetical protein LTSEUGA_1530 [Salmonella enterica subsp. enterica serovar Uganda str. R8-3404]|uniref:Uncharacterized protein n=1 Tax=Salmonella enterica subsp. enterica serovar Uganda str. R8-3404 TaxID=913083 RepID=A0A6C8H474_SALET|nr:hypothetical protein LTSEUGA_1530 [Salmonella enterica subsp. enterica serovar Uganda str. R8-3404]